MSYCNLHDDLLDNNWYMSLPDNQRVVWIHLMALASKDQGVIRFTNLRLLAGRIGVTQHSLRSLIASAQHRLSIEAGVSITFTDWLQWNVKRDVSKDRVRSYREKKRVTQPLQEPLRNGHVTLIEEEEEEDSEKKNLEDKILETVVTEWNKLASDFLNIPKIVKLSEKRKTHALERMKDPVFKLAQVLDIIRGSPFLRGEDKKWAVSFDWIFSSTTNYLKVLEGNYTPHQPEPKPETYTERQTRMAIEKLDKK